MAMSHGNCTKGLIHRLHFLEGRTALQITHSPLECEGITHCFNPAAHAVPLPHLFSLHVGKATLL